MNITFLIGNGFDIGLGMLSRFTDYFPVYLANYLDKSYKYDVASLGESSYKALN